MTIRSTSHYKHIQHYYGLSTDSKPTKTDIGDKFIELDTGDEFLFNGTTWEPDETSINTVQKGIAIDGTTVEQSYEKDPQGLGVQRTVIAAFPNLTLTHTTIAVSTTSTIVLPANSNRKYLLIVNDSDTNVYVSFGTDAVIGEGIPINSSNCSYEQNPWIISTQAINAIHNVVGETKNLLVTEGV